MSYTPDHLVYSGANPDNLPEAAEKINENLDAIAANIGALYEGSASPTENDDSTAGYRPLDLWGHGGSVWICADNTAGAAIWLALPSRREKAALTGTSGDPGDGNRFVTNEDARMTDARTPTSHGHAWTDVSKSGSSLADLETRNHGDLAGVGTNSHAEIDTHLAGAAPHSGHERTANKGQVGGYASLDENGKVPADQLPTSGGGAAIRELAFDQATSSPASIFTPPNDARITRITVQVGTAASGGSPTISVGTSGDPDRDLETTDVDLLSTGFYAVFPMTATGNPAAEVFLTITPDGQTFSGTVWIECAEAA